VGEKLGYRQFVEVARGELERGRAVELMQRDTLRYAKRQLTWFAREPGIEWIDVAVAGDADGVAVAIEARLQQEGGIE